MVHATADVSSLAKDIPMIGTAYLPAEPSESTILSFQSSFPSQCYEKIIQHQDLHQARERISNHQKEGSDVKETLSKHARLSAGNRMKEEKIAWESAPMS